jgi:hypothetical protein
MSISSADLREEGALLARYLLGREAPPEAAQRYVEGCAQLFVDPASPEDSSLMTFIRRHAWSLPCLDAACGLLHPRSLLRQKLILMLAILETIPGLAETFIARPAPRFAVLLRLAATGFVASLKIAAGVVLLPAARRAR